MNLILLKFFYFHLCYKMIQYKKEQEKTPRDTFLDLKQKN